MKCALSKSESSGDTLMFWCPGCDEAHGVRVDGSRGWTWDGSLEAPTISPSILVRSGHYSPYGASAKSGQCWCNYEERVGAKPPFKCEQCHFFVKNGRIQFLSDCTHKLAGQTVELPEWGSQWSITQDDD